MIKLDGFDYQVSCMLRKTDEGIVLKSCPFSWSEGHGDKQCTLLLALEMERLQKAQSDDAILWMVDDAIKAVFGDVPPARQDYTVLARWKFPDCPMRVVDGEDGESDAVD